MWGEEMSLKRTVIQDITSALGISRTSVWKALNNKEGISETLKSRIIYKAKELNYPFPHNPEYIAPEETAENKQINIAVAVCRPESSVFWTSIIHQISLVLAQQNVNLIYVSLPHLPDETYTLPKNLCGGMVQGIIVLNVYSEKLIRLLVELDTPKVFFDTIASFSPGGLKGDLVLMENENSMFFLTEYLIKQGRKRLGFIGDVQYAKTNMERYNGFCAALSACHISEERDFSMTGSISVDRYRDEVKKFIESLREMPDAFVCANDYTACIVLQVLHEKGIKVPGAVAVTGFDDNMENPFAHGLSTVHVYNADIGCRLAWQILYRIRYPDNQYEVIYIRSTPVLRSSSERSADRIQNGGE